MLYFYCGIWWNASNDKILFADLNFSIHKFILETILFIGYRVFRFHWKLILKSISRSYIYCWGAEKRKRRNSFMGMNDFSYVLCQFLLRQKQQIKMSWSPHFWAKQIEISLVCKTRDSFMQNAFETKWCYKIFEN